METSTQIKKQTKVRKLLEPIILTISWADVSRTYFGRSRSWLYQKFTGYDGHTATDFTEKEQETMKNALFDLSEQIRRIAEKL